jgi:hypothetical protein
MCMDLGFRLIILHSLYYAWNLSAICYNISKCTVASEASVVVHAEVLKARCRRTWIAGECVCERERVRERVCVRESE